MRSVSQKAGLGPTAVRDMLRRGRSPSIDSMAAIARTLGVSVTYLLEGEAEPVVDIPIVGIVSGGEGWEPIDAADPASPLATIAFELGDDDFVGFEVRGNSMSPVYRDGDTLICQRRQAHRAAYLVGHDCVVHTRDGNNYVKILQKGRKPGVFRLRSYASHHDDIEDVTLSWVAPIIWIRRALP